MSGEHCSADGPSVNESHVERAPRKDQGDDQRQQTGHGIPPAFRMRDHRHRPKRSPWARNSAKPAASSASVFMTNGPRAATGSRRSVPAKSSARMPWSPPAKVTALAPALGASQATSPAHASVADDPMVPLPSSMTM